jgi:hypothetical protein
MTVTELPRQIRRDPETGGDRFCRRYQVQRPGRPAHLVIVEVSPLSDTPQAETCTCRGYKYRRDCAHIAAVMETRMMKKKRNA